MTPVPEVLPDVLEPGLKVVFCGTAAGTTSAKVGAYYAGPGNLFWPTLYAIGLTPRILEPEEYGIVNTFGVGLTNLAKHTSGADKTLRVQDFDTMALRLKVRRNAPRALAFNSKRAAQEYYRKRDGQKVGPLPNMNYGIYPEPIGMTTVFVLPSTSGLSKKFWDLEPWKALAQWLKNSE
jgi:TDG/mug DNA glycosylase family protein